MSLFRKLKESFGKGKLKKEQEQELQKILADAVLDGAISDSELNQVNSLYLQSELSEQEFRDLKDAFFWNVVEVLISDRKITELENRASKQIAMKLEISSEILKLARNEILFFQLLEKIENGELPICSPDKVVLKKGETAHFEAAAFLQEEQIINRKYVGGSHGVSIRIARGLNYRIGATRGKILAEKGIVNVSSGNFVITDQRLMFSGDKKSFAHNLTNLIDLQLFSDGIKFSVSNRQKPIIVGIYSAQASEVSGLIISTLINK